MARGVATILAEEELGNWLSELRNGRGISQHTHIAYLSDVSEFLNFQNRYDYNQVQVLSYSLYFRDRLLYDFHYSVHQIHRQGNVLLVCVHFLQLLH